MKVEQFLHANQFTIWGDNFKAFQSYNKTIVKKFFDGRVLLDNAWDYSSTTRKHFYKWMPCDRKETLANIKNGKWIITDLNS
jgi:hypothetical protein